MNVRALCLPFACILIACTGSRRTVPESAAADPQAKPLPPHGAPAASLPSVPSASVAPTASLRLEVVHVAHPPGGYQATLTSSAEVPVEIEDELSVEALDAGVWKEVPYKIRRVARCTGGPAVCEGVSKSIPLRFPAWHGMSCDERCPCRANVMLEKKGPLRFVAKRCGGGERIESEPFAWPP